jgi:putative ABC transport system permease protein
MYMNSSVPTFCVPTRDDAEQLAASNLNMRQISLGIAGAGLFMILFLCANGVAESVRERLAEFGMLKTLGYSDRKVGIIVLIEAAIPTLLGALLGTGLAGLVGMQITRLSVQGKLRLPQVPIPISVFATALAVALLIAALSAIVPLQRLKRMDLAAVMARR